MTEGYIFMENVTVGYGRIPPIGQIEFHVRRGEIVTLIGPNGAGKPTILKSIIRQLGLLKGTVYLDEWSMEGMTERQIVRHMSVLITEWTHLEPMICKGVMGTGRYPYTGRPGILTVVDHEKVREAMELVHAGELADRDFMGISDGQERRILLARVICQEPETVALDGPTSFLGMRRKLELLTIPKSLVREKKVAVLMPLHELDLVQKLPDSVVCAKGNAIERCGTPEEIFVSSYTKGLYGITKGSYHAEMGYLEMEPAKGEPKISVIGGNGSGIPIYRKLQHQEIPFVVGILRENDMGYPVARALAPEVIPEIPFESIRGIIYEWAVPMLESCEQVVCRPSGFGTLNEKNRELVEVRTCLEDLRRI